MDPRDILKLAETESTLWVETHILNEQKKISQVEASTLPSIPGRWYFTDASWKEDDIFLGQGWYNTLEEFEGLMGQGMYGLSSLLFVQRWKRYYGQWNV